MQISIKLPHTLSPGNTTTSRLTDHDFSRVWRRIMLPDARKVFEDITQRRATEAQVQELLQEKDMLLGEIQH
jgi:hypothetical protein